MKRRNKQLSSLLLVMAMLFSLIPGTAFAAGETENQWNGKSAVFVGDSITAGLGTTKIYYEYLQDYLGFSSMTPMGVAGSCISAASDYGQGNQPLISRYQNIPSGDLIVIFMGTNDYGHETPLGSAEDTQDGTFYGALNTIIPALVSKHPDSKIVFVTPLHRYGFGTSKILGTKFTFDSIPNGVGATLGNYVDALKAVCASNGVSVIDLYTECTLDPADSEIRSSYMPDGLHPNAAGHEVIAGILESHIKAYSPLEKSPETEYKTELVYGNRFSPSFSQQNRASSRVNQFLKAGTVITLKDVDTFQWTCTKTNGESSNANLGYFPDSAWSDKTTAVVASDGWVGFVFKYRDESQVFDLTKPLSDYISIEPPRLTLSILGDSISTYANHSNGTAAETSNSTISGGAVYYPRSGFSVTAESTWWYQAAQMLDMDILVNNSWSGSCLLNTRSGTVGAYMDRCVQLHDDTGSNAGAHPDLIAIFLGTNDYYTYPSTLGSYEAIDFDRLITWQDEAFVYAAPTTTLEAHAITFHKIAQAYPAAKVYCFTLLPRVNSTAQPTAFNEDICQLAEKFGVATVDLYHCGILPDTASFYKLMGDNLHPDNPGMTAIANAFVSAVLQNTTLSTHTVSFSLEDAVSLDGTSRTVVSGKGFETTLAALDASLPLEISVTMGGVDISESCRKGNTVTIPAVTGDVIISAKPGQRGPMNFRWETQNDVFTSVTSQGNEKNPITMTHGSITDGVFSKTRFTLEKAIRLQHDLPWCVEWKSTGTWTDTTDGALLFAEADTSTKADAYYFYRRHNNDFFAFGSCIGGRYHNYGVSFSGTGIDTRLEHTYRLENRISDDGSNMIWLQVDGQDVGPMNQYFIGGTNQNKAVDWVSGKDFCFAYMGTSPHTIGGCSLEYIQVWEQGKPTQEPTYSSYRWETQEDALVSVTTDSNQENPLTMTHGTITDGNFSKTRFTLEKPIRLQHDLPWCVEWKSTGTWTDTTDGALLFAEADTSTKADAYYFYRRHNNDFFAFGSCIGGRYHNYGVSFSGTGIDTRLEHTYRLENRISDDGSNMIWLQVDGQDVGPMNQYFIGGTNQNKTVDWVSGKDFSFAYMGTSPHTIGGCSLEYIQVWENEKSAQEPELKFYGANIALQTNLAIGYGVPKNQVDAFDSVYVRCTMNGVETDVVDYQVSGDVCYFFFRGISPRCIGDDVVAQIIGSKNGVEYVSAERTYSILTYCQNMLENIPSKNQLSTLLVDLLNYGTAIQTYTNYKTDAPVSSILTETQKAWGTATDRSLSTALDTKYETVNNPLVRWKGAGLTLKDSAAIRYLMVVQDGVDITQLTVKLRMETGAETMIPSDRFTPLGNGIYEIYFDRMNAAQMNEYVYAIVCMGNTPVSHTARYSVESYAYSKQNSTDSNLAALVTAMIRYGDSAKAFVEAF